MTQPWTIARGDTAALNIDGPAPGIMYEPEPARLAIVDMAGKRWVDEEVTTDSVYVPPTLPAGDYYVDLTIEVNGEPTTFSNRLRVLEEAQP